MLTFILLLACFSHLLIAFPCSPSPVPFTSPPLSSDSTSKRSGRFSLPSSPRSSASITTPPSTTSAGWPVDLVGSYILDVRVSGHLYGREALKQGALGLRPASSQDLTCMGVQCFRLSFITIAATTLLGEFVAFLLGMRTGKFYKGDVYTKFREEGQG